MAGLERNDRCRDKSTSFRGERGCKRVLACAASVLLMRGVEQMNSVACYGGIKTGRWCCLGHERQLRRQSPFPLSPELQSGSWTSRRGAAGCGSQPRARSRSLSWKTRLRVRRRAGDGFALLLGEENDAEMVCPGINPLPLLFFFRRTFCPGASGAVPWHRCGERDGLQQIFCHPDRRWERYVVIRGGQVGGIASESLQCPRCSYLGRILAFEG